MKPGARSIRGAMGTYMWVSAATVLLLGLLLWLGPDWAPSITQVTLAAGWEGALLEDGTRTWELRCGEALPLPEGSYRLTLFALDGEALRSTCDIRGEALLVGAADN